MRGWLALSLALSFTLSACGPSEAEILATTTKVAAELFGTQTALAPTLIPTSTTTPTITPTLTPTPTLTSTPRPPTATLTAAGVEMLTLCYKAAVSVQADWEAHRFITGTGGYSDSIGRALNAFLLERTTRAGAIKVLDKHPFPMGDDTLVLDGLELDCDPHTSSIFSSISNLRFGPWGVGNSTRISMARMDINSTVKAIRKALLGVDGFDPAKLEAIEEPIWRHVQNRYGVTPPG